MTTRLSALLAIGLAAASFVPAHAQKPFSVEARWTLGGDGGWDYLLADPANHRLFVTHGPRVEVVDTTIGKPVGAITGLKGTHGVALDPNGSFGYISDGGSNAVVVIDLHTLATVATIPAGTNPDGIVFEPRTRTVWAFNGRSKNASVIDAATNKVIATIALPGKPEFPAVDGTGTLFVNIEDKGEILKIDAIAKTIVATWPLGVESPTGLAIDTASHRLFPVCDGKVMPIVDYTTGKVIATAAIGNGPDAAAFDPASKLAFSSNGADGTLSIVDTTKPNFPTIQTLATQKSGRTMAFDSGTGKIYIVVAEMGPRPAATPENPHPRPTALPGSFSVLVVGRD